MLIMNIKQNSSLINLLRSLHEILSGPEANKPLHLLIALLNFSFEKGAHSETGFDGISSKILVSTWQL